MINTTEAARLLGAKPTEIASIGDSPAGVVISTVDGCAYLVAPDDAPDHEGKTGLMLLAAPSEPPVTVHHGRSYWNAFPLYVSPGELDDEDPGVVSGEVVDYESMSLADLRELPAAGDLTPAQTKSKKAIIEALTELAPVADLVGAAAAELAQLTDDELAALAAEHSLDIVDREALIEALAPILVAGD